VDTKVGFETIARKDGRQPTRKRVKRAPENVIETRVFGGDGQPPQLIDDATWHSAQEIITKNKKRHRRARKNSHEHVWASGFLYSAYGDTGVHQFGFDTGPIRVRHHVVYGVTAPRTGFAYRCRCHGKVNPTCGLPQIQAPEINAAMDRLMVAICRSKKFQRDVVDAAVNAAGGEDITTEKTRLGEQLRKAEQKRDRVLEGFEAGLYSVDEAKKRTLDIKGQVERLQVSLDALGRRDPEADREATRRHFAKIEMWDAEWNRDQKTAWMKKYIGGVIISTEGVEVMILRLPRGDGTMQEREHHIRFGWTQLGLDYNPTDRGERATVKRQEKGEYQTGDICEALGFTFNRVAYLLRAGKIERPTGRKGRIKVWSQEAFDKAVEQGRALKEVDGRNASGSRKPSR